LRVALLHANSRISLSGTIPVDAVELPGDRLERIAVLADLFARLDANDALPTATDLSITTRRKTHHICDPDADPLDASLGDTARNFGADRDLLFHGITAPATSRRHAYEDHQQRDEQVAFHQREWLWHVSSRERVGTGEDISAPSGSKCKRNRHEVQRRHEARKESAASSPLSGPLAALMMPSRHEVAGIADQRSRQMP
jgi:hypothetical protein